jgi:hypothetical protein
MCDRYFSHSPSPKGILMKIAFARARTPGHLNAMTTLARKIKDRWHGLLFNSRLFSYRT